MPYSDAAEGFTLHDADSHVMETAELFCDFADPGVRARMRPLSIGGVRPGEPSFIDELRRKHRDPEFRSRDEAELMTRKNWTATGSFVKEDRPRALDLLGFSSQLVFNTFGSAWLVSLEHGDDVELCYGAARAHNRALADFCAVDRRLLATGYVPLRDFARARAEAEQALALGCKALLVASACPRGHSPSHVALDAVWAVAQEAGAPVLFHACSIRATSRTACPRCPTSTAAPRTSAPSTTWRFPTR
jgi:uncharacterized protein